MKKVFTRPKSLKRNPFHYCPGCGHSIIHRIMAEVIDEMNLQYKIIGIPPPGCSVFAYHYFDVDMSTWGIPGLSGLWRITMTELRFALAGETQWRNYVLDNLGQDYQQWTDLSEEELEKAYHEARSIVIFINRRN